MSRFDVLLLALAASAAEPQSDLDFEDRGVSGAFEESRFASLPVRGREEEEGRPGVEEVGREPERMELRLLPTPPPRLPLRLPDTPLLALRPRLPDRRFSPLSARVSAPWPWDWDLSRPAAWRRSGPVEFDPSRAPSNSD
mmetsp:Transcript_87949/g.188664  ORF Transcript_87949/g.188664 Transcript_87949/m.188664 type:complete len:140 (+) Transcript_87949:698-1117(+)